jgi:hypothetical protein
LFAVVCVERVVEVGNEEVLLCVIEVGLDVVWVELTEVLDELGVVEVVGVVLVVVVGVVVGVVEVVGVVDVGVVEVVGSEEVVCVEDVGDEVEIDVTEVVGVVPELDGVVESLRLVLEFVWVGDDDDSEEDALLRVDIVDVTVKVL